jgi:CHAT domain-containing protein/Tfp pilus assembly protein PilF
MPFFFFLLVITDLAQAGFPQEPRDLFEKELITVCLEDDKARVRSLIEAHRLWIKPVVDRLVTDYCLQILDGQTSAAMEFRHIATLIAQTFRDVYGESSLVLAVSYPDKWSQNDLIKKLRADSLVSTAILIRNKKSEHEQAIAYYQEALALYEDIGDERGMAEVYGALGFIQFYRKYWYGEDPQRILDFYTTALELRERVDDQELIGKSLNDIGLVYYNFLNDYPKAVPYLENAIEIRKEIGDMKGLGSTLMYLGISYENNGQTDDALRTYLLAFETNKTVGDINRMGEARYMSGIIFKNRGKYQEALNHLEQALKLREELGDPVKTGNVLNVIGIVYWRLGDYDQAIIYYTRVADIMKAQGNESGLANAYNNLGIILNEHTRYKASTEYLERALALFEKTENQEGIRTVYGNLGNTHHDMGAFDEAERYQHKALQLSRELNSPEEEVHNLINLSNAQNALGKLDSARFHCELALEKARRLNSLPLIWVATINLGDNFEKRGDYDQAITYYDQALSIIEDIRHSISGDEYRAYYMAQERFAFEGVIHMLARLHEEVPDIGYDRMAFKYAERSKARSFLDLISESLTEVQAAPDPEWLRKYQECFDQLVSKRNIRAEIAADVNPDKAALEKLHDEMEQIEKELEILKREARQVNPEYDELRNPQAASIQELQASISDPKMVVLEYYLGDSSSCLWLVTRDVSQMVMLPSRDVFIEPIETIRFSLTQPDESNQKFFEQSSRKLYELLIQPIESHLERGSSLVIIPDGELFYLPFEVLLTRLPKPSGTFSDYPYIIREHPISYGPSATVWLNIETDKTETIGTESRLLAFGDPVFESETGMGSQPGNPFKRLEYSAGEVENIGAFFPAGHADILTRENASESRVKSAPLPSYDYIHFATHGVINELQPDFSYLALSHETGSQEDGMLHAAEIFNLELDAELVSLSACQTGLGKMVKGEGLIGLTRAFIYAGTPSVLVSLWSVADRSTAELMIEFYKNLIGNGMDKSQSLRESKLYLMDQTEFSHPFYWAPFVIVGDWQ